MLENSRNPSLGVPDVPLAPSKSEDVHLTHVVWIMSRALNPIESEGPL
jgi:hypothetical protein